MKIEFEKTLHITSELMSYCHLRGACDFTLDISVVEDNCTQYKIKASPAHLSEEELALLDKKLHIPRQPEMEQDFWGLSGESGIASELSLVGMMTDEAIIKYDGANFVLDITLNRKDHM